MSWLRDAGGTVDADLIYHADLQRFSVLDGTATGPGPIAPPFVPPPTLANSMSGESSAPDGTARQPWNGFAGEGASVTVTEQPWGDEWWLGFPGGSCRVGIVNQESRIGMVSPSPDGSLVAVRSSDVDGLSWVTVRQLSDGADCPIVVQARYVADSPTPSSAGSLLVWKPDSSALAYGVSGAGQHRIVQLPIAPGATPSDVVAVGTDRLLPLGWSVADRLLFARTRTEATSNVSRLVTRAIVGGAERLLDTARQPLASSTVNGLGGLALHFGYFIPGTTDVVYDDGSSSATNTDGLTFPRFYVALIRDADGASSAPILGAKPPLAWHQEQLDDTLDLVDVPDAEFLQGFLR